MKNPVSSTGTNGAAEQRTSKRKSVIDEQIATADLGNYAGALVLDVSEGGISLHAVSGPREGETTPVTFDLPGSTQRITAQGTVQWAEESGRMGLKFHHLDANMRAELRKWIEAEHVLDVREDHSSDAALEALLAEDFWDAPETAEKPVPLSLIVEQITWSTRASGAAIALDGPEGMVCRASFGNAPAVGVPVKGSTGLSGECLRTSAPVRCVDTEVDPRVDRLACRQVKVRSITIVPVTRNGRAIGLLEVFSPDAHAFGNSEVAMLIQAASTIAAIPIERDSATPKENAPETAAGVAPAGSAPGVGPTLVKAMAAAATAEKAAPASIPEAAAETKPIPVEAIKPPVKAAVSAIEKTPELAAPITRTPTVPADEQVKPPADLKFGEPPKTEREIPVVPAVNAPEPKKEEKKRKKEAKPGPAIGSAVAVSATSGSAAAVKMAKAADAPAKPEEAAKVAAPRVLASAPVFPSTDFTTLGGADAEAKSGPKLSRVAMAAGVIVAVAGLTFAGWRLAERSTPATASTTAPSNSSAPAPIAPAATAPASTPNPAAAKTSSAAAPSKTAPATAAPSAPSPQKQPSATGRTVTIPVAEPPKPAEQQPLVVASNPAPTPAQAQVTAPPTIPLANNASAIGGILGAPEAAPKLGAVRVSEGVSGGKLLQRVQPIYPAAARATRITGAVSLMVHVDKKGNVANVQVQSGPPILVDAAVQAVRRWKYEPFQLNGQPIENDTQVTFRFDLPK